MAQRKKAKRTSKKASEPAPKSKRGRKIPVAEIKSRIEIYNRQEAEGFTNAEAAEMLDMGLPAWNQWKQKYRRSLGPAAGPIRRGRRPSLPLPPSVTGGGDINSQAETIRLRSKLAEAETFIAALKDLLSQYHPGS